ncbi:hypothetical protein ACIRU3_19925 [Streptomyces sp. NPDC101151]|uniref:hypothetical protein n=1 Tax=Streptomyces sp. NPDC101151 TaxID=3366115 RepID=UPI00380400FA
MWPPMHHGARPRFRRRIPLPRTAPPPGGGARNPQLADCRRGHSGPGCGHLGVRHATAMAGLVHEVAGVDVDQVKVDRPDAGEGPIHETGLPELCARHRAAGAAPVSKGCRPQHPATRAGLNLVCMWARGSPPTPGHQKS